VSIDRAAEQQSSGAVEQESGKKIKLSKLRRFILLGIIILFLFQFLKIKVLVGGLTGSLAVWFVNLIDVFAYLENLVASKDFSTVALIAVLPVIGIYLIFGRAFCGWVCPMDFLVEMVDKIRSNRQWAIGNWAKKISPKIGYGIAGVLLVVSALVNIPFFTNYISHLTNFFRMLTGGVFLVLDLPVEPSVLVFSTGGIFILLFLEYLFPRLWCRVLCPLGKIYGLFNKISLLKLKFMEGKCHQCIQCEQLCYMNVKIARHIEKPGLRDANCIYCGRCVEACQTRGKLIKMKFGGRK
jgi:ferredoxin-type protein NapH